MKRFFAFLRAVLLILCIFGIGFSVWKLWEIYHTNQEGKSFYQELASRAVLQREPTSASEGQKLEQPGQQEQSERPKIDIGISVDFDALRELAPELVGWIYCPDTAVNYPVAQGEDNDYYLTHLLDGTTNRNGTIFVDAENSSGFVDQNTILYGHHMKSGAMFAALEGYREQTYYDQHPVLYLLTPEEDYQLQVFSAYVTSATDEVYTIQFDDAENFQRWLGRQKTRSDVDSDVSITGVDRVITLSTCAYDFYDARYVVLAKLVPIDNVG